MLGGLKDRHGLCLGLWVRGRAQRICRAGSVPGPGENPCQPASQLLRLCGPPLAFGITPSLLPASLCGVRVPVSPLCEGTGHMGLDTHST